MSYDQSPSMTGMEAPTRPAGLGTASALDEAVPSPCIRVCRRENDTCTGCKRTLAEIASWGTLSALQKRKILAELPFRTSVAFSNHP